MALNESHSQLVRKNRWRTFAVVRWVIRLFSRWPLAGTLDQAVLAHKSLDNHVVDRRLAVLYITCSGLSRWVAHLLVAIMALFFVCEARSGENRVLPCERATLINPYASVLVIQVDNVRMDEHKYSINDLLSNKVNTTIVSNQRSYVASLYSFLCGGKYVQQNENGFFDGNNYIGILFSGNRIEKNDNFEYGDFLEIFTLSGRNLYGGDGYSVREVDDSFVGRFNFSDDSFDIIAEH